MPFSVHVLTGSIAVGKTTVADLLKKEQNFHVFDSDEITRILQEPGQPGYIALKKRFPSAFDNKSPSGKLDRQKLADIVFEQSEKGERERRALNGLMQPLIMKYIFTSIFSLWMATLFSGKETIVIVDAPVYFEMLQKMGNFGFALGAPFTSVVVVSTTEELQLSRLQARGDGCSENEAKKRIAAQIPLKQKEKFGDHIVRNDSDLVALKKEASAVVEKLRKENAASSFTSWNKVMLVIASLVALISAGGIYIVKAGLSKVM